MATEDLHLLRRSHSTASYNRLYRDASSGHLLNDIQTRYSPQWAPYTHVKTYEKRYTFDLATYGLSADASSPSDIAPFIISGLDSASWAESGSKGPRIWLEWDYFSSSGRYYEGCDCFCNASFFTISKPKPASWFNYLRYITPSFYNSSAHSSWNTQGDNDAGDLRFAFFLANSYSDNELPATCAALAALPYFSVTTNDTGNRRETLNLDLTGGEAYLCMIGYCSGFLLPSTFGDHATVWFDLDESERFIYAKSALPTE